MRYENESRTANFKWDYRDTEYYSVTLFGPLGTYTNRLIQRPNGAQLVTDKGEVVEAVSVEGLSEKVLGFRLPVQSITWWATGKPDPSQKLKHQRKTANGIEFTQRNWAVKVIYPDDTTSHGWPHKVVLTQNETRAVLVFDKWMALQDSQ